jgi:serine/threonine protein kinase
VLISNKINIKERQEFENYRKIKLLGEGSFGKAFLVERESDNVIN